MWRWIRVGICALGAWLLLAWGGARWLIKGADLSHADAIVVFSGSSAYLERTRHAAQLFREGRAPRIILTNDGQRGGWSDAQQRNLFFVEREAEELKRAGVPADRIEVLSQVVSSTYEEAELLRAHAAERGLHSLLFVTSTYHSRRALWTLRRSFEGRPVAIGLVTATPNQQTPAPSTWWLRPGGWRAVAGEYPKLIYYWIFY